MNTWDERYSIPDYYYGTEPNDFLKESSPRLKTGGEVLCLAEGEGRNAIWLAQNGFHVTAVDSSRVALEKLQKLAEERRVKVTAVQADLAEFKIDPLSWDGIVSIWCHLPSLVRKELHKRVIAGLKNEGVLILEAYTPKQLGYGTGGPSNPDLMPSLDHLRSELTGLKILHACECDREIHEGIGHNGISAVVQFLAQKPASKPAG